MIGGRKINLNRKGTLTWLKYRKNRTKGNWGKSPLEPLVAVIVAVDNRTKLLSKFLKHKRSLFRDLTDDTPRFVKTEVDLGQHEQGLQDVLKYQNKAICKAFNVPYESINQTEFPEQT